MYPYIAIEGNIGAGKSELARIIAETFNRESIFEAFADKAYLERFYQDRERYAFPLEISFLVERYEQLNHSLASGNLFKPGFVSDYCFDKSLIFARQNLNEDQYHLFKQLFDIFSAQLKVPDIVLYLHRPIEKVQEHIRKRARPFEAQIPDEYLTQIEQGYLHYFKSLHQFPVIVLDLGDADFVNDEQIRKGILNLFETDLPNGLTVKDVNALT